MLEKRQKANTGMIITPRIHMSMLNAQTTIPAAVTVTLCSPTCRASVPSFNYSTYFYITFPWHIATAFLPCCRFSTTHAASYYCAVRMYIPRKGLSL